MDYYTSENIECLHGGIILLPKDGGKTYPVLYLIHGTGGFKEWKEYSEIFTYIETLANNRGIAPFIVVMPFIPVPGDMVFKSSNSVQNFVEDDSWSQFFRDFDICVLVDYIKNRYSSIVQSRRECTAIGGFSVGASSALYQAIKHPDIFSHWGAVSVASITQRHISQDDLNFEDDGAIRYFGYGSCEGDGFTSAENFCLDAFKKYHVSVHVDVEEGKSHNFGAFNPLLRSFVSMLFKD